MKSDADKYGHTYLWASGLYLFSPCGLSDILPVAVARVAAIADDNQASLHLENDRQARDVIGECARTAAGNCIIYVSRFAYVIIKLCARSA